MGYRIEADWYVKYFFFNIITRWKDLYWMVEYKMFTSKVSEKCHSVLFNEEN